MVKIRKVVYNCNGYRKGILLHTFIGTLQQAFDFYGSLWMHQNSDKTGKLDSTFTDKDVDMMVDEFVVKDTDHFFIGMDRTFAYEGITEQYEGYGCELDEHGFELMRDSQGNAISYTTVTMESK